MTTQTKRLRPSRRAILAGMAAAPVAATLPTPTMADTDEDAELLALGQVWQAHLDAINAGQRRGPDGDTTEEAGELDEAYRVRIVEIPARTIAGVALKLAVAWADEYPGSDPESEWFVAERALHSALRDAERLAGRVV